MIVTCGTCGKQFDKKPAKVGLHNYCSRKCLGAANGKRSRRSHLMVCDYCGKKFEQRNRHAARNNRSFCSRECGWAAKIKKIVVHCEWCGRPFEKKRTDIARTNHNLCDRGCYQYFINFTQLDSPNTVVGGKVLYRTLAEMKLGRKLTEGENVHHIDGNHSNNSVDNLKVLSKSEHMSIHASLKRRDAYGRFINEN